MPEGTASERQELGRPGVAFQEDFNILAAARRATWFLYLTDDIFLIGPTIDIPQLAAQHLYQNGDNCGHGANGKDRCSAFHIHKAKHACRRLRTPPICTLPIPPKPTPPPPFAPRRYPCPTDKHTLYLIYHRYSRNAEDKQACT